MADEFSFDIVSKVDEQAVDDAVNSANMEITNRFDFKGSVSRIEYDKKNLVLTLYSDNDQKLKSVMDVLRTRFAKRNIPQNAVTLGQIEKASGDTVRQEAKIVSGISVEKAKEIVKVIKDSKIKVTPSIQGDHVRVASRIKDLLQEAITLVRSRDWGIPLQFTNYR